MNELSRAPVALMSAKPSWLVRGTAAPCTGILERLNGGGRHRRKVLWRTFTPNRLPRHTRSFEQGCQDVGKKVGANNAAARTNRRQPVAVLLFELFDGGMGRMTIIQ